MGRATLLGIVLTAMALNGLRHVAGPTSL